MAKTVVMPQMGYDMDAGTLLRWLKHEGDSVERGDPIAEIETDKVNIEIEAFESGVLRKTLITEGTTVPVGDPIAIIGTADEPIEGAEPGAQPAAAESPAASIPQPVAVAAAAAPAASAAPPPAPAQPAAPAQPPAAPPPAPPAGEPNGAAPADVVGGERLRASPLVRRLAAEHGINLAGVRGTGPHGRIVKRDIEGLMTGARPQAAPAAPAPPTPAPAAAPVAPEAPAPAVAQPVPGETVELSRIRQTIGRRMGQSWQNAPHFFVTSAIDMGKALELRAQVNEDVDDATKLSVNDLIVKAAALALRDFPVLNASYVDGKMETHASIDVGIAVAIEGGLISPFIPETDKKSLGEIARMTKDLVGRARTGGLKPEEYAGGTFTISNLGMYDVYSFTAIINPPQAAILATGTIAVEANWNEEAGAFEPRRIMKATVSADHRLTDGAEAARFLQRLKQLLEQPMGLLVG